MEEKVTVNDLQCREILLQVKWVMASFLCYDNSDVIATLIITNFHLYLIQLLWQFFQIFVYDDVVYAQTWEVFTLKNCIETSSTACSSACTEYIGTDNKTWSTFVSLVAFVQQFLIETFNNREMHYLAIL